MGVGDEVFLLESDTLASGLLVYRTWIIFVLYIFVHYFQNLDSGAEPLRHKLFSSGIKGIKVN